MDSLTQLALGAAIGVAVMGRRTKPWKAALWGGMCGTLPDLDALVDFGDAVSNMTYHRAESHGLFFLTLLAPFMGWLACKFHGEEALFKRWTAALWLALFTHPLLDTFTIYGTQLLQPFSEHPYGIGSMFIIDPMYTLPLLGGLVVALSKANFSGLRWNVIGLGFSCLYLGWSLAAQTFVEGLVRSQLRNEGTPQARFLVTPTPFNTIAWRVVVMRESGYAEGFYSLLDKDHAIAFDEFPSQVALKTDLADNRAVQRMAWFTHGFYSLREEKDKALIADLRMGQEPGYVFQFVVAQRESGDWKAVLPTSNGFRGDPSRLLPWLWARIQGNQISPPR